MIETASADSSENGSATISSSWLGIQKVERKTNFGLCLQDDCVMGDELVGERILDAAG